MNIGYNVKQAEEVMKEIKNAYNELGLYTSGEWSNLVDTIQAEWVGEDEQDFEQEFAKRLCKLYVNAYNVAQGAISTIAGLVDAWYEFQAKNTLSGGDAAGKSKYSLDVPTIKPDEEIVKAKIKSIGENVNRGLKDASSRTKIEGGVSTFVKTVQDKTKGLFEAIEVNTAFFGDQTTNIKAYVEAAGAAVGEVTVAVKDLNDALAKLVGTNYTSAISDISTQFSTAKSNVEQSLNDLGSSRWTA